MDSTQLWLVAIIGFFVTIFLISVVKNYVNVDEERREFIQQTEKLKIEQSNIEDERKKLQREVTTEKEKLYAVCVGAYTYENAKAKCEELKKKGYSDTYLIPR